MPKRATDTSKTLGIIKKIETISTVVSNKNRATGKPSATRSTLKNIKQTLLKYTTQTSTHQLFQHFKLGAMIFFLGLVIIYGGYQLLEYSLAQEIVFLMGLVLIGGGFILAMLAQVRMLLGRLIHILFHKTKL